MLGNHFATVIIQDMINLSLSYDFIFTLIFYFVNNVLSLLSRPGVARMTNDKFDLRSIPEFDRSEWDLSIVKLFEKAELWSVRLEELY